VLHSQLVCRKRHNREQRKSLATFDWSTRSGLQVDQEHGTEKQLACLQADRCRFHANTRKLCPSKFCQWYDHRNAVWNVFYPSFSNNQLLSGCRTKLFLSAEIAVFSNVFAVSGWQVTKYFVMRGIRAKFIKILSVLPKFSCFFHVFNCKISCKNVISGWVFFFIS